MSCFRIHSAMQEPLVVCPCSATWCIYSDVSTVTPWRWHVLFYSCYHDVSRRRAPRGPAQGSIYSPGKQFDVFSYIRLQAQVSAAYWIFEYGYDCTCSAYAVNVTWFPLPIYRPIEKPGILWDPLITVGHRIGLSKRPTSLHLEAEICQNFESPCKPFFQVACTMQFEWFRWSRTV